VTCDGVAIGLVGIADEPRLEAREALSMLARLGITRTVMLTGDNERAARNIAARVGVAGLRAELLPEDKAALIASLGNRVLMVGDGVNDAPGLAPATVGVAVVAPVKSPRLQACRP
jgi:P-type E1-E2 ATPase